ncbi:hypothetical protein H0H87_005572 [Tephrocybe sp. NHM501043]|nr:hypothetical protein H0H87_005572 [Tephrocybe sp. NHM501043]
MEALLRSRYLLEVAVQTHLPDHFLTFRTCLESSVVFLFNATGLLHNDAPILRMHAPIAQARIDILTCLDNLNTQAMRSGDTESPDLTESEQTLRNSDQLIDHVKSLVHMLVEKGVKLPPTWLPRGMAPYTVATKPTNISSSDSDYSLPQSQEPATLLDSCDLSNGASGRIITAMRRLSAKTNLYPLRFFITGPIYLVDEDPVSSGSFGDVYKATARNEVLCLKVLRANKSLLKHITKANVLVDSSGRAYLADFGISNIDDPQIAHWTSQSSVASKGGSARWQAPELHQAELDDNDDHPNVHNTEMSDVFAWGCLCYEIFSGHLPFSELRLVSTVVLHISKGQTPSRPRADSPSWLKYGLTEPIWKLMKECWLFDPGTRPSMQSVVSRLESARPSTDPRAPPQWPVGSAMRFRNAKDTPTDDSFTLNDLDVILQKVVDA